MSDVSHVLIFVLPLSLVMLSLHGRSPSPSPFLPRYNVQSNVKAAQPRLQPVPKLSPITLTQETPVDSSAQSTVTARNGQPKSVEEAVLKVVKTKFENWIGITEHKGSELCINDVSPGVLELFDDQKSNFDGWRKKLRHESSPHPCKAFC